MAAALEGRRLRIRGLVQGVGFRPFVFHLARRHGVTGSVMNSPDGVEITIEGTAGVIDAFVSDLRARPPSAARIDDIAMERVAPLGATAFQIHDSERHGPPSAQLSPDLSVCDDCLGELFDPANRRFRYPYINCAHCGPRFSLTLGLPYDRESTTMAGWRMCAACHDEFHDPADRRFHAQPIACPDCGPRYRLFRDSVEVSPGTDLIAAAARLLAAGEILAIKGLGGYHLACDARNATAVGRLRHRKYRKHRAFALMLRDLSVADALVTLEFDAQGLLTSRGRPIVLAAPRVDLPEVAPDHPYLGVMLPYTPLHHLLFASGAPDALVMTSGNRSNEPIAFDDRDACVRLEGIADVFLVGERPIARRVDDSVAYITPFGPAIARRSRGYAPAAVARLDTDQPILAVGGDLKNTVALVVRGDVIVSQHIGDLEHQASRTAFEDTIRDLLSLYRVDVSKLTVVHDAHPQYASTGCALEIQAARHHAVQHHRAHIASVLAERQRLSARVVALTFDGTGFGDDGTIWGGEVFAGSVAEGFNRIAHLLPAPLPGGDAAAKCPAQAAAGFVSMLVDAPDLTTAPFLLPGRYGQARRLVAREVRTFTTSSVGRLFDVVAALLGFTGDATFEAHAAIWLEHQAASATRSAVVPFEYTDGVIDWRPALRSVISLRLGGAAASAIAHGFHRGFAEISASVATDLCEREKTQTVVLTGGVFQNAVLLRLMNERLAERGVAVWTNLAVPAGDGGLSLGQAAVASVRTH
jgi:hydrogenase maturation protein HypF